MSAFNNGAKVKKADLKVGDVIWINTTIDTQDIADPDSETANRWVRFILTNSETHYQLRIRSGEIFGRYAVVITKPRNTKEVLVVYLATFGGRKELPTAIDPAFWVAVHPARREVGDRNIFNPIGRINGISQWVSIRRKITIRETEVSFYDTLYGWLMTQRLMTGHSIQWNIDKKSS